MPPVRGGNHGMKGLGFGSGGVGGREMGESEREEGEAYLEKEEGGYIDPDVDLSYIDLKLQDVLGHLQREFEGGVFVENFGAKFGDYGSFLPTYKRSPSIFSQPRSTPKETGGTVIKSPNGLCEGACNDSSNQINAPIAKKCPVLTKDLDLGGSARNYASTTATTTTTTTTTRNHVEDKDLVNKGTKGSIQNTLKVRIKVGPENISDRNKSAIYSGLGLDLSSSSSLEENTKEDSPEGIKGTRKDGITNVSTQAILQMMKSFPISKDCFLSPLQENLLRLANAGENFSGNCRGDLHGNINSEAISISGQLNLLLRSTEDCEEAVFKLHDENVRIRGKKSMPDDDKILEKKVYVETPEGQDLTLQTSSIPLLSDSRTAESKTLVRKVVSKTQEDSAKGTKKTFNQQTESSRILLDDNNFHSRLGNRNSFEPERSMESDGTVGLKERAVSFKSKLSPRDSFEKNMICGKNDLSCMKKECMDKPENGMEIDGPKFYKDHIIGTKLNTVLKADKPSEIKGKLKTNAADATSVTDLPQKTMVSLSLFPGKDEKKLHAREAVENKSKRLKSTMESLYEDVKHSQREVAWEGKDEVVVGRTTPLNRKNRIRDSKMAKKMSRVRSVDNKSAISMSFEAPIQTCTDALICDHSATDAAVPAGPIIIKDNWACCDICEKWRLLPNGTNPDDLPKKWTCSMQFWLPVGMNRCIISEDEITNFMNPQCHASLLESNAIPDHSAPSASSASVHVNHVRRLSDASMDTQKEKLKAKGKSLQCSSNGVGIIQSKDSKLIGKGLINSDISGPKKIINPDGFHLLNKDRKLSPDLTEKVTPYLANGSSAADLTGKQIGEFGDKFLGNSVRDLKGSCSSLNGTMKAHVGVHTAKKFKQPGLIDSEISDNSVIPVKKRKARKWNDIQNNQTALRSRHLGEKRAMLGEDSRTVEKKENKFYTLNSAAEEYSRSKMTDAIDKSHDKTRWTYRTGKLFIDGKADNQVDVVQPSAEGNSSTLKLSSSSSPMDLVLSSPLRACSSEKHSQIRNSVGKTDAYNLGTSSIERSNRYYLGEEVNGKMSQGSRRKEKNCFIQQTSVGRSPACKSRVLSQLDVACSDHIKASSILDGGKAESEAGGINVVNSVPTFSDHHNKHHIKPLRPFQNHDKFNEAVGNDEDIASSHCEDGTMISESGKRFCIRDRNNTFECEFSTEGKMKLSNVLSEQEELHSMRNGMQGTPNQGRHVMASTKAKGLEVCPTGETVNDLLELDKLAKASDNMRREKTEELSVQCPMRKSVASNAAALVAMKDAKELKHAADRMKNLGLELEGTALYFQAALKFLQAAFLSEPSSVDNIKYDELNELLKTYTQTAALCEFCAREYEQKKDMAFAALAYKCMEVAYFKVAYFKSNVASKDLHELQATTRTFLQDDSPSSSASGLDNLNQPGALEKVTYSKVANSLQNTGSHGIVSRATFTRWLDYANVSIFAFEASRKSQNALLAASASLEKNGCGGSIGSVEDALNFNFHDVEELLRRIRAAMESFNH